MEICVTKANQAPHYNLVDGDMCHQSFATFAAMFSSFQQLKIQKKKKKLFSV